MIVTVRLWRYVAESSKDAAVRHWLLDGEQELLKDDSMVESMWWRPASLDEQAEGNPVYEERSNNN